MKDFWHGVQIAFAAIGGWLGWFLGGVDGLLYLLIAVVAIDYITGVMCAIAEKKLSSDVGFKGLCRKILIFLLVAVANNLDQYILGGDGSILRTAIIFFYISNEGISLLENATRLGLPIPNSIRAVLIQLHDKSEGASNDMSGNDLVKNLAESLGVDEKEIAGEITDETASETENGKGESENE